MNDSALSLRRAQISDRIPELDGARGVAVLVVLLTHYFGEVEHGFAELRFGWMGVYLFFVLSGFLIGSIIMEHKNSPNFLAVFYVRRTLRILPVYFVVVAATLAFIWLYKFAPWADDPLPAISYFTFTQNFVMAWTSETGTNWLFPTWTLAVEEQFYLVVPFLIMLIPARYLLPAITAGIVLCLLTRVYLYSIGADAASRMLLFTNGHILLIGVAAAYVHRNIKVREIVLRLVPLIFISAFLFLAFSMGESMPNFFMALMAPLFASYILLAARGLPKLSFLRAGWLRFVGSISYCLYLIHQPVNGVMHGLLLGARPDIDTVPKVIVTGAAIITSIALSWASLIILEGPLLRLGRRLSY